MSEEAGGSGVTTNTKPEINDEEDDDEHAVTMLDVLEEENSLEQDANAVLGGSDDQNCTYEKGYIPRQALYACMTCVPLCEEDFRPAGVCLACSYNCHEGHELVELYTKRNFKCDCGNDKFGKKTCNLCPEKDAENEDNKYNHNFKGVYCVCGRPYPDPDDTVDDEMVQCIVCEDWFHGRHLDLPPSITVTSHNFAEMICGICMEKHDFLWHYADEFAVSEENGDVSVDISMDQEKNENKEESHVDNNTLEQSTKSENRVNVESPKEVIAKEDAEMKDKSPGDTEGTNKLEKNIQEDASEEAQQNSSEKNAVLTERIEVATNTLKKQEETVQDDKKADEAENMEVDTDIQNKQEEIATEDMVNKNKEALSKQEDQIPKDEIQEKDTEKQEVVDMKEANDACTLNTSEESNLKMESGEKLKNESVIISKCYLSEKEKTVPKKLSTLWPTGWRTKLCTCDSCKVIYKDHGVQFLPDEGDMVQTYEDQGKQKNEASGSQYEQGLKALSRLDRVRQLDAIEEYNKMQVELKEFLAGFAAKKRIVREEDIKGFFAELQARKKRRIEGSFYSN